MTQYWSYKAEDTSWWAPAELRARGEPLNPRLDAGGTCSAGEAESAGHSWESP